MSISFDDQFGLHAAALKLRGERHQLLAENLANADTPGYKARDIDFASALEQAEQGQSSQLQPAATHARHMGSTPAGDVSPDAFYREPQSPSLDGNTVESHKEQAAFAENAVQYRAALTFLGGKVSSLVGALRGE